MNQVKFVNPRTMSAAYVPAGPDVPALFAGVLALVWAAVAPNISWQETIGAFPVTAIFIALAALLMAAALWRDAPVVAFATLVIVIGGVAAQAAGVLSPSGRTVFGVPIMTVVTLNIVFAGHVLVLTQFGHLTPLPLALSIALAFMSGGASMLISGLLIHRFVAEQLRTNGWKVDTGKGRLGEYSSRFLAEHTFGIKSSEPVYDDTVPTQHRPKMTNPEY